MTPTSEAVTSPPAAGDQRRHQALSNVFLVVPVYNEATYIGRFVAELAGALDGLPAVRHVVFVDDGSSDATPAIITEAGAGLKGHTLLRHARNQGKGTAMRTGLDFAMREGAQAVIFMDGDCQHRVEHLPEFLEGLAVAPVVFGYRRLSGDAPWVRRTGNRVASLMIRSLFGIRRRDLLCGFMALRADAVRRISWSSQGYGVETELACVVARKHIDFTEVTVTTVYLDTGKGVKLRHAFRILAHIPGWYFRDVHDLGWAHPVRVIATLPRWGWRKVMSRSRAGS